MDKIPHRYVNKNIEEIQNAVNELISKQGEIIDELKRKTQAGYGDYSIKNHKWEHTLDIIEMIELICEYFNLEIKNIKGSHKFVKRLGIEIDDFLRKGDKL